MLIINLPFTLALFEYASSRAVRRIKEVFGINMVNPGSDKTVFVLVNALKNNKNEHLKWTDHQNIVRGNPIQSLSTHSYYEHRDCNTIISTNRLLWVLTKLACL